MIDGVWGTVPLVLVLVPPLEWVPLWIIVFLGAIDASGGFEEDFGREGDLEYRFKL